MELNKTHCMDARDGLCQLPDNSVDMVITSPPYWKLRDFGESAEDIWDGETNCKHQWNKNNFCTKCNAWKGQLGLEPEISLYIKHLMEIFDEV